MQFSDLGLCSELLKAVAAQGYSTPSPIQAQAIPAVLAGRDVMGAAQTGTGKTAGFTLPMLQRLKNNTKVKANHIRALVITPTRELAAQVSDSVVKYSANMQLRSSVVYGGVSINPQMQALRRGTDVLVATPGRLLDLHQQNAIRFDQLEILVLDEADRMLDMGFIHDIKRILKLLPTKRQTLLFSATFSDEIRALAKGIVGNPLEIDVAPRNTTVERVEQNAYAVDQKQKSPLLIHLINTNNWNQVLVFSRTKHGANRLTKQLEQSGIPAAAIHGNKSQGARTKALADFKANKIQVLVATDIAARGIDIDRLPFVVNFDLPNVPEDYVHRIGRTGRAGATGLAVSLVSSEESKQLKAIERLTKQTLTCEKLPGFTPAKAPSNTQAPQNKRPGGNNGKRAENTQKKPARRESENKQSRSNDRNNRPNKPLSSKAGSQKPGGRVNQRRKVVGA